MITFTANSINELFENWTIILFIFITNCNVQINISNQINLSIYFVTHKHNSQSNIKAEARVVKFCTAVFYNNNNKLSLQ